MKNVTSDNSHNLILFVNNLAEFLLKYQMEISRKIWKMSKDLRAAM